MFTRRPGFGARRREPTVAVERGDSVGILIVGGDRVRPIQDFLEDNGVARVHHWPGRRSSDCHRQIPQDTRLVVIFIDYVNHGLATKIRGAAKRMALPVVYSRRSNSAVSETVEQLRHLFASPGGNRKRLI